MKVKSALNIFIPCHNSQAYISDTIKSILVQSYRDFLLYVVDNNSTDRTIDTVKQFKDDRIIIIKNKKNIGMFGNMNKCIRLAKAKYTKIVCSDDLLNHKDALAMQVSILDKYPQVNLVYNASQIIYNGKKILERRYFSKAKMINGGVLINAILKSARNPIGEPTGVMFRTSIPKIKYLRFDERFKYISDLDFWLKLLKFGDGYYINQVLSSFRIHRNSGSISLFSKALKEHLKLLSIYWEEFNLSLLDILFINLKLYINSIFKSIF
ncbi:glycosyltransferase, partial [Candidatus Roizmanbacteria bacterium]|nr:glycosyltransferase [Candidatus Roizmanbacteria bacterium]